MLPTQTAIAAEVRMTSGNALPPLIRAHFAGCDPWNQRAPFLLTLTGVCGSGKTILARELERCGMTRIVTTTTRSPRAHELSGLDYHFLDAKSFASTFCSGGFIEATRYLGHWYAVGRDALAAAETTRRPMCVVLDPRGVRRMRVFADERGWRMQSLFVRYSRDQLARTLVRRFQTSIPEHRQRTGSLLDLLKMHAGWEAELRWDAVVTAPTASNTAGLATRLLEIAQPAPLHAMRAAHLNRRLSHGT
jgi:guanylate kinase